MNDKKTDENLIKEISLEEYKVLWDYYKYTLAERKNLYEWYFKIIALPATLIGLLHNTNIIESSNVYGVSASNFVFLIVLLIFLTGMVIFASYALQAYSSTQYFDQINDVREFMRNTLGNDIEKLFPTKKKGNTFQYALLLSDLKNAPIAIINSGIVLFLFNFYTLSNIWHNVLIFIISILLHIALSCFISWMRSRDKTTQCQKNDYVDKWKKIKRE